MSPKRTIFIATGIFAGIGILVSVVIIAINGGFSGAGGPSIFNPPTSKDLWTLGSNIADGMNLTYSVTSSTGEAKANLIDSIVSMRFHNMGEKWNIDFRIQNGSNNNNASEIHTNYSKNQLLRTDPITEQDNKFLKPVEASVLAIRDIAREPKYLVVGAVWDTITVGPSSTPLRISNVQRVDIGASSYDSFVLSYEIANVQSTIYISKELPFPLKAEVYDENGTVKYSYELESIRL
jgi:hypothetical protein